MSAAAERSLFATKGRAAPNGAKSPAAPDPAPHAPQHAGGEAGPLAGAARVRAEAPAQAPLPLIDAADKDPSRHAAAPAHAETHPAGSLLTFRLRGAPGKSALTDEIKSALLESGTTGAAAEVPAPQAVPAPPRAAPAPRDPEPAQLEFERPEPAPPTPAPAAPAMRRPDGLSSSRIDRPLFPRPSPARDETPPAQAPMPAFVAPRPSAARTVLPAAAAVLAVAVVGWLIADSEPPASTAAPDAVAQPAAATSGAEPETGLDAAAADTATATPVMEQAVAPAEPVPAPLLPPATPETESPAAAVSPPAIVPTPAPDAPATAMPTVLPAAETPPAVTLPAETPPAVPATASSVDGPAAAAAPTLDVVRVEPDAPPVLAGRAAPGSELIVLDNGAPIGTAIADVNGEWALVSDTPLPAGRHEFSLALKTPDGAVVVEQADTPPDAAPGSSVEPGAEGLPVPPQKPAPGASLEAAPGTLSAALPARLYVIQLASVPSVADAEREWARLQQAHPAQLGGRAVEVNAAEVGDRGTFYRVRIGPFADRDAARELCRELNAVGQECLVIRAAAG
jgi:cell division septation protein DedD